MWLNLHDPAFGAYLRAKLRSMILLLWIALFVISLVVLITAARYFTRSAEIIGLTLGMSSFATGVIIVALGTSGSTTGSLFQAIQSIPQEKQ